MQMDEWYMFQVHHSTGVFETFTYRCPSSVSLAGSEEPSSLPASPRGKPRGRRLTLSPFTEQLAPVTFGRMLSAPTSAHPLKLYYWIKMFKLGSGFIRTKLPIHSLLGCVSSGMPCGQTFIEVINGRNAHIQQALSTERG